MLCDTSNNRAKKLPLEFLTSIERTSLRVRYVEGFGGAPLRIPPVPHRITTAAGESGDEKANEQGSKTVGGNDHV